MRCIHAPPPESSSRRRVPRQARHGPAGARQGSRRAPCPARQPTLRRRSARARRARRDASHADDRQAGGPERRVDGGQRDRPQRRPRVAACRRRRAPAAAAASSASPRIVFTSESPSAPALATARASAATSGTEGESFAQSGSAVSRRAGRDDLGGRLGRLVDVGAREVELDRGHIVATRRARRTSPRSRRPRSRRPRPRPVGRARRAREHLVEKALPAGVREADRVEHPRVASPRSGPAVSLTRLRRDRLRDEGVELPRRLGAVRASRQPDALSST